MGSGNSKQSVDNDVSTSAKGLVSQSEKAGTVTNAKDDVAALGSIDIDTENDKEAPSTKKSGCPMHQADGSYSYDWRSMFRAAAVHGPKGTKPLSKEEVETQQQQQQQRNLPETVGGGCPVRQREAVVAKPTSGGCPVKHKPSSSTSKHHPEYNVYSQPLDSGIDKTNQMPKGFKNQLPSATQQQALSTHRVSSTIPKGGGDDETEKTWTYPSPQQFYNALVRKGKMKKPNVVDEEESDEATEQDMESVVALHNNMNEKTWSKIVEWERHIHSGGDSSNPPPPLPKLLKFEGRPHDLSPKGWIKHNLLGHPLPFDRHDWIILRHDGTTARYVMDYYYDESKANESVDSAVPALHDTEATSSLLVDVRPALDSPTMLFHRAVTMPYKVMTDQTNFTYLPLRATGELANQVAESIQVWQDIQKLRVQDEMKRQQEQQQDKDDNEETPMVLTQEQAQQVAHNFSKILTQCRKAQERIQKCESDDDCRQASIDMTLCMGAILCPLQHESFKKSLTAIVDDDDKQALVIEATLETLSDCVVHCTAERRMAKEQFPNLFAR